MNELGVTIKKLRKEKKLTLAQLAGDRLTKGMLSLIENGKAQPSMESLRYIAGQLEVEVTALLHNQSLEQKRALLLQAEEMMKEATDVFREKTQEEILEELLLLLAPQMDRIQGSYFEEVRLMDLWMRARCQLKLGFDLQEYKKVLGKYEEVHAFTYVIKGYSFLCWNAYEERDYKSVLEFLLQGEQVMNDHEFMVDDLVKLDLYYNLALAYGALNDSKQTEVYTSKAMELSKRNRIYYRLEDFYRLMFSRAVEMEDQEKSRLYLTKLRLLDELAQNFQMHTFLMYATAHYANYIEKDYRKTIMLLEDFLPILEEKRGKGLLVSPLFQVEQAYAHWQLAETQQVIDVLATLYLPEFQYHPFDLVYLYFGFAIRAAAYHALGNHERAKQDILYAHNGCLSFSDSKYKSFIVETYGKIMK